MRPDLLSILSSIIVQTSCDRVLEEKFILSLRYPSTGNEAKKAEIITDFAVPELPTNNTGCLRLSIY